MNQYRLSYLAVKAGERWETIVHEFEAEDDGKALLQVCENYLPENYRDRIKNGSLKKPGSMARVRLERLECIASGEDLVKKIALERMEQQAAQPRSSAP